ncbi:MAG: energy-coupling factor ABC transporter permease [Chloroflexota bacterium]|jgi:cobalt/nickel transport system permease protein
MLPRLGIFLLHIPDGFLSVPVALIGWLLAVVFIALALRQTRQQFDERQIPLMGVMAAFIFAAQAINFPVLGGTSGHLLGGALAAIVLGPWSAVLVMAAVIGLQGLLFQDGGLLVMGWNIVNMGVLTVFSGAAVYRLVRKGLSDDRTGLIAGGAAGAWLSVMAAAVATSLELAASGTSPLNIVLPAMLAVHALIGIGEAIITVGALLLIHSTRPDLLRRGATAAGQSSSLWVGAGLVLALIVAFFSFAASGNPDGLERVAEDQGFLGTALDPLYNVLPDYTIPFIENETVSGIIALAIGTLVVFGLALLVGQIARRQRSGSAQ